MLSNLRVVFLLFVVAQIYVGLLLLLLLLLSSSFWGHEIFFEIIFGHPRFPILFRKNVLNHAKNDIQNIVGALDAILDGYKRGQRLTTLRPSIFLQKLYDNDRVRKEVSGRPKFLKSCF